MKRTDAEFTEAFAAVCESLDEFMPDMEGATLEARNLTYARQRLLDCLEACWKAGWNGPVQRDEDG